MYERRDAAFEDWALNPETVFKKNENGFSKADLQSAFNAGWDAIIVTMAETILNRSMQKAE